MSRFYTQKGDDGYTGLLGNERPPKYDARIEAIGAIDEANAALGISRSLSISLQTPPIILSIQRDLYHLMSEIAAAPENAAQFRKITAERVSWLESQIEKITNTIYIPDEFIIPGDSQAGAAIDLARTIVRRSERQVALLLHQKIIENPELLRYLNRLSSLCFALELMENLAAGSTHSTLAKEQ